MSKKNATRALVLLTIVINLGVWLMGTYGLEVRVGSHVFGRYIGINDKETWSSLLGWVLVAGGTITLIVIMYRKRS
ncbi:MAG: hypothetical protein QOJ64_151 [Acidobacteriota bacterium]|jgi:hypothetical protein|nr:hypothetical protein [Acidobacteriota bacterium]